MGLFNNNIEKRVRKLEETVNNILDFIELKESGDGALKNRVNPDSYWINKDKNCVCFVKSVGDGSMIKYNAVDKCNGEYHIINGGYSTELFSTKFTRNISREEYESWLTKANTRK